MVLALGAGSAGAQSGAAELPSPPSVALPAGDDPSLPSLAPGDAPIDRDAEPPLESAAAEAAVAASERFVTFTENEFGRNSLQTAEAYVDLAEAQHLADEHDAAEASLLQAIEIYRAVDGPFTPLAIPPLARLGDNYHDDGRFLNAVSAYGEARTVHRRVYGLLSEEQIVFLDKLSATLLELDQPIEADQQQQEALRIVERNWPPESPQYLNAIYKYASWLRGRGQYQLERDQYARALRIIREHYGKDDARQVAPLVGIGNSFRNQRIPEGQGAGALNDALALLLAEPAPDKLALAEVLRDLGDWEVAFSKVGYEGTEYRRAWQLLGEIPDGEQLRSAWFSGPNYVLREPISLRGLSEDADAPSGHVLVRFDLNVAGQGESLAVIESVPPGLKDEAVLRHIRRSRFRPQMVDGELVPGKALALQFNFRYTPDAIATQTESNGRRRN